VLGTPSRGAANFGCRLAKHSAQSACRALSGVRLFYCVNRMTELAQPTPRTCHGHLGRRQIASEGRRMTPVALAEVRRRAPSGLRVRRARSTRVRRNRTGTPQPRHNRGRRARPRGQVALDGGNSTDRITSGATGTPETKYLRVSCWTVPLLGGL
jgi:hypothetical protein